MECHSIFLADENQTDRITFRIAKKDPSEVLGRFWVGLQKKKRISNVFQITRTLFATGRQSCQTDVNFASSMG